MLNIQNEFIMRKIINHLKAGTTRVLLLLLLLSWQSIAAQNVALNFDGDNDYVLLNAPAGLAAGSDFTVEMLFKTGTIDANFRRLFGVGALSYRFEVGIENGVFTSVFTSGQAIAPGVAVADNQWHCLSIVSAGGLVDVYIDGSLPPGLTGINTGVPNVLYFRLGHWAGYNTPGQDWQGDVDEFKVWNSALNPGSLTACSPCAIPCNSPGLIAYWHFDDGIPNGNNTTLPYEKDCTANGNNGLFYPGPASPAPFALTGATSNFVPSSAPILYPDYNNLHVKLTDPTQSGLSIAGICEGEPVHFAIVDPSGTPVSASAFATVQWEYSDDCFSGATTPVSIPGVTSPSALFSGFSFVSPPNDPVLTCAGLLNTPAPNGFVNRCYRAIITVNNGINSCTYVTQPAPLQICCKLPALGYTVTPAGPKCENDVVTFTGSITGIPAPALVNNYHITWVLSTPNGPINLTGPAYDDQLNISYGPVTLIPGTYCLNATVSNCLCPSASLQHCFVVDPMPVCGTISIKMPNSAIMGDPDLDPDHFLICPKNTAELYQVTPFTNCIPQWEYMLSTQGVWKPLGSSNSVQNTNVLPQDHPPISPYLWPAGETMIFYRIKCTPLSGSASGCPPCYSNIVKITLKQPPPPPVISASPQEFCKGSGSSTLSVANFDPNCNYDWFQNGVYAGSGNSITTSTGGCFWVTCYDGCFTVTSNKVCVKACEVVVLFKCPMPDCPKFGAPVTLDGSMSYSTCGNPVTYLWTWTDATGTHTDTNPIITVTPDMCGTEYTLKVTDAVLGCMDVDKIKVTPCQM